MPSICTASPSSHGSDPRGRFTLFLGALIVSWLASPSLLRAQSNAQAIPTMPLHVAAVEGKVSVQAECIGGATGDRLKVFVQKKVKAELHLTVSAGTVFSAVGANVQSLAVVQMKGKLAPGNRYYRGSVMVLKDNQRHGFLMQTVCIDYHRSSASVGQRYQLQGLDARCARILSARVNSSLWACQAAVWMDRAGVAQAELQRRFKVSQHDLASARDMLSRAEQVGIQSLARLDLSAEVRREAEGIFSSDPKVRAAAYAQLQKLKVGEQQALLELTRQNILRDGRLPSAAELLAGNTLESLMPEGLGLPRLQIQQSLDGVLDVVTALQNNASASAEDSRVRAFKLATQLRGLKSKRTLVRAASARSLGRTKDPHAVEALILALDDDSDRVRSAAAKALEKLTGQPFGEDQDKWSAWWEESSDSFHFDDREYAEEAETR